MAPFNRPPGQPSSGRHIGYGGKAAANNAAAIRRNVIKKEPGGDAKKGFFGDLAQMGRDLSGYDQVKDSGFVKNLSQMGRDLSGYDQVKKYLSGLSGLAQRMTSGATRGWDESQEAKRDDGKFTFGGDEIDISRGTPAYKYLLDNVIQPEYKNDFRREVGKDNLHWPELNKYAGDKSAGLAARINLLNDPTRFEDYNPVQQRNYLESILDPNWKNTSQGIEDTAAGRRALNDYIAGGKAMEGQGMIGSASADVANNFYGDRDVLLDMNVPYKDKYVEQFDIAEALSPYKKYLLQSQALGRGGSEKDYEQAMINAGFDMDYIGPKPKMTIDNYPYEDEDEGYPFHQ